MLVLARSWFKLNRHCECDGRKDRRWGFHVGGLQQLPPASVSGVTCKQKSLSMPLMVTTPLCPLPSKPVVLAERFAALLLLSNPDCKVRRAALCSRNVSCHPHSNRISEPAATAGVRQKQWSSRGQEAWAQELRAWEVSALLQRMQRLHVVRTFAT